MRLSADSTQNRIFPYTLGESADAHTVRLPRRLSLYFAHLNAVPYFPQGPISQEDREERQALMEFLQDRLSCGGLNDLLDNAVEFARGAKAFHRRPPCDWRVGDPCYITGEGHGYLFYIQVIQGSGFSAGNGWESLYKAYPPTYLELVRHLWRDRWDLKAYEKRINRWTPKQLKEQNSEIQREVKEAQRLAQVCRASIARLEAWMAS